MTITKEQLDAIERAAKECDKTTAFPSQEGVGSREEYRQKGLAEAVYQGETDTETVLKLVAIARAALAWNETRHALVEAFGVHDERCDDESHAALLEAHRAHDVTDLVAAIEGKP